MKYLFRKNKNFSRQIVFPSFQFILVTLYILMSIRAG